jgi:hypothetical protein
VRNLLSFTIFLAAAGSVACGTHVEPGGSSGSGDGSVTGTTRNVYQPAQNMQPEPWMPFKPQ